MTPYIYAAIFSGAFLLIAAIISNLIKFEGGSNPKDPGKRKLWFWVIAILTPIFIFIMCRFILAPNPSDDQMVYDEFVNAIPFAAVVGLGIYILLGLILSKAVKHSKLGHWF